MDDHGLLDVPADHPDPAAAEDVLLDGAVRRGSRVWIDTYQAVIIPGLSFGLPLAVWNLTAFFKQLPVELEQAAMVDGCTPAVAFRKVILPLAAPGVFTTAIIVFIGAWNEFLLALTFLQAPDKQTATVAISKFTGTTGFDTPYGTIMAAGVIVTVPLLIAVLTFQRRIVAGLTAGGVIDHPPPPPPPPPPDPPPAPPPPPRGTAGGGGSANNDQMIPREDVVESMADHLSDVHGAGGDQLWCQRIGVRVAEDAADRQPPGPG